MSDHARFINKAVAADAAACGMTPKQFAERFMEQAVRELRKLSWIYLGELRGSGASSNREARPIRREGAQEVGSEPRLNDIAEPARIECGPGEVGVFVDCEEDQARRPPPALAH